MSAVSSTFGTHYPVHSEECAISLSLKMCRSNPGSLVISFQVRNLSPTHASLRSHNCDHDYQCRLPREGERDAQSITRCWTAHHRDVRAVPRANRTFSTARNPIPCATSSTGERRVSAPSLPWRSSVPAAWPDESTYCAIPGGCSTVTWAASTSRKRNIELPCLVICPSRLRFPLESSHGTSPR